MANDTNKIKLLVLWDILCKNTDENHAMNFDEIQKELAKRASQRNAQSGCNGHSRIK